MDELAGKRIYIVEDNAMNMAVFAATLRRSAAVILQDFWNSNTIYKMKQHLPIDCVLLDLMLHFDLSGYDIFDKIKADLRLKHIPVIAVSGADPDIEIPKAKAKGFAGFIGKPIKANLFPDQIAACIKGESIWYASSGTLEE